MPSRKIIPIFVACFLSLGLIFFAVTKDKWLLAAKDMRAGARESATASDAQILVEKALQNSAERDDDGDGLKNWEETFWKTDPKNPDSDGDGISDSEEVKEMQKNELTGAQTSQTNNSAAKASEPATKTDEISRNLFSEYLALKQSGGLNQTSVQNLINRTVSQINSGDATLYSLSNIKTIPDSDSVGAKIYGNSLAAIRQKYKNLYRQQPIVIIGNSINFEDEASLESVRRAANLYKLEAEELLKLFVPQSLAVTHLNLVNNYISSSEGLRGLADLGTDPIRAIAGIQGHTGAASAEPAILFSISEFFLVRGIVFSPSEPGARINEI